LDQLSIGSRSKGTASAEIIEAFKQTGFSAGIGTDDQIAPGVGFNLEGF